MSRYTGSVNKQARRVGFSILESGKELTRRPYGPGQHGQDRKGKLSNYGEQLKEKQKVRFMYGVNERQFRKTFEEAGKLKGIHGENFLRLLESRLDNVITVNGNKVDIPSYRVKVGDVVAVKENSKEHPAIKAALEKVTKRVEFVTFDDKKLEGKLVRLPERSELNADINESLIVEFYNR